MYCCIAGGCLLEVLDAYVLRVAPWGLTTGASLPNTGLRAIPSSTSGLLSVLQSARLCGGAFVGVVQVRIPNQQHHTFLGGLNGAHAVLGSDALEGHVASQLAC